MLSISRLSIWNNDNSNNDYQPPSNEHSFGGFGGSDVGGAVQVVLEIMIVVVHLLQKVVVVVTMEVHLMTVAVHTIAVVQVIVPAVHQVPTGEKEAWVKK